MKQAIILGLITLLITAGIITVINQESEVKIDVSKSNSKLYLKDGNNWALAATEKATLLNGTKTMRAQKTTINATYDSQNNQSQITRQTLYANNIEVHERYDFEGKTSDVTQFPLNHFITVKNGKGLTLKYAASGLEKQPVAKSNLKSQIRIGKVKIVWRTGEQSATLSKAGTFTLKYLVKSENEEFGIRLFDPPSEELYVSDATISGESAYLNVAGKGKLNLNKYSSVSGKELNLSVSNNFGELKKLTVAIEAKDASSVLKIKNGTKTKTVRVPYAEEAIQKNGTAQKITAFKDEEVQVDNYDFLELRPFEWNGKKWLGTEVTIQDAEKVSFSFTPYANFLYGRVKYSILVNDSSNYMELDPVLESGLTGYWDGSGTGNQSDDISGNNNNASIGPNVFRSTTNNVSGVYFNRSASPGATPIWTKSDNGAFDAIGDGNAAFTLGFWYIGTDQNSGSPGHRIVQQVYGGVPEAQNPFSLDTGNNAAGTVFWHGIGVTRNVINFNNVSDGEWHSILLKENATGAYLYFDGLPVGNQPLFTAALLSYSSGHNLSFGCNGDNGGTNTTACQAGFDLENAGIDEIAFWNRTLTDNDILMWHYNGTNGTWCAGNPCSFGVASTPLIPSAANLSMDGFYENATYEFGTTAQLNASFNNKTGGRAICINITFSGYQSPLICDNETALYNLTISLLRHNRFNDSEGPRNFTASAFFSVNLDNRTFLQNASVNLSGFGNPENITISINKSAMFNQTRLVILPGFLNGSNLVLTKYAHQGQVYSVSNISFTAAGIQTVYLNVSTVPFQSPIFNLSFNVTGFDVDSGNSLSLTENFNSSFTGSQANSYVNFSLSRNSTAPNATWENFEKNLSGIGRWASSISPACSLNEGLYENGGQNRQGYSELLCTGAQSYVWTEEFDVRNVTKMNVSIFSAVSCGSSAYGRTHLEFTDGTSHESFFSEEASCGLGESRSYSYDFHVVLQKRPSSNTWDVTCTRIGSVDCPGNVNTPFTPTLTGNNWRFGYSAVGSGGTGRIDVKQIDVSGIMASRFGTNVEANSEFRNITYVLTKPIYTANPVTAATLYATDLTTTYNGVQINTSYELSNDNGTSFMSVRLGERKVFPSTGRGLVARIISNSTSSNFSLWISNLRVEVTPTSLQNLTVDVGSDGVADSFFLGTLTTGRVFNHSTPIINYLYRNCNGSLTCKVPISLSSATGGIVEVSNFNYTRQLNPLQLNKSYADVLINQTYILEFASGTVQVEPLFDYRGNANFTITASYDGNTTNTPSNLTRNVSVRYSPFSANLPANISSYEFFARTRTDRNTTPRGQANTTPIWNVTSLAYDNPINLSLRLNQSLNSTGNFVNLTFSKNNTKTSNLILTNSTSYMGVAHVNSSVGFWNFLDVNITSLRFLRPVFIWTAICADCVRTFDYDKLNVLVN